MRVMFNHGMTPTELYTNTPKKILDKPWTFFIKEYGYVRQYEDFLADPFRYCFGLILNEMLDNKVRFVFPVNTLAYLDFDVVMGDKFEEHMQLGRFDGIDFIESGFMAYDLRYYYRGKSYIHSRPAYLGGPLKQKFWDGINSGVKYYTINEVKLIDFIDRVWEKFKFLTRDEIKILLLHGFRRMQSALRYGCSMTFCSHRLIDYSIHIGSMVRDPKMQYEQHNIKHDKKLRKIAQWKREPFDGWYYVGLNTNRIDDFIEKNKNARNTLVFENIMPRKIQEEWYYKAKKIYIFRFKVKKFKGFLFWASKLKSNKVEYVGEANNNIFTPTTITWKQLIKEYETGKHQ